jgi:hypothetical protein
MLKSLTCEKPSLEHEAANDAAPTSRGPAACPLMDQVALIVRKTYQSGKESGVSQHLIKRHCYFPHNKPRVWWWKVVDETAAIVADGFSSKAEAGKWLEENQKRTMA